MAVTPQTNATLAEIAEAMLSHDDFCICGHINPDGDCIGSTLGLYWALKEAGKRVVPLLADDGGLDESFRFMPGADELVCASAVGRSFDVFVMVDAPGDQRIGEDAAGVRKRANLTITLDHHATSARESNLSYTDPDSASTTLIIWELAGLLGVREASAVGANSAAGEGSVGGVDGKTSAVSAAARNVAVCCYSGLVTDTGRFMYQNTNIECFKAASEMVACGASPSAIAGSLFQERTAASVAIDAVAAANMRMLANGAAVVSWISALDMEKAGACRNDAENAINVVRSIRGVEVACMLKERDGEIRGSLRAKGDIDVAAIAREYGGGGHVAAAGFTMHCTLDEAVRTIEGRLAGLFDRK